MAEEFAMTAPDISGDLVVIKGRRARDGRYVVNLDIRGCRVESCSCGDRRSVTMTADAFQALLSAARSAGL